MGEYADIAIEEMEMYEGLIGDFRNGNMSQNEAYELGIIDELGFELDSIPVIRVVYRRTCKYCGKKGLKWKKYNKTWRLFDENVTHRCKEYTSQQKVTL